MRNVWRINLCSGPGESSVLSIERVEESGEKGGAIRTYRGYVPMRVEPDARDNGRQSYCRSLMCTREFTAVIFPWRTGEQ